MSVRIYAAIALAAWGSTCWAQGTVYESKDKAGPVFSDRPGAGAKPVDVPTPNVIQTDPLPKERATAAPPPAYTALAILGPASQGNVHSNTGAFDVDVRVTPALRTAAGDRIRVTLDGKVLPATYASTPLRIREADWQFAASGDIQHTLQLAVVDRAGKVLIESAPAKFYVRRATQKH